MLPNRRHLSASSRCESASESPLAAGSGGACPSTRRIASNAGKAIFGAVVVGAYYLLGGFGVHAFFRRYNPKDYKRMSLLQYSLMQFFLLTMVALPLKMLLRLGFNIKYVWITPWFNV